MTAKPVAGTEMMVWTTFGSRAGGESEETSKKKLALAEWEGFRIAVEVPTC